MDLKGRLVAWGALLLGALLSLWGVQEVRHGFASKNWPATGGQIHSVERGYRQDPRDEYYEEALYTYTVKGRPYRGDRIRFGPATSLLEGFFSARKTERSVTYPKGAKVKVYYKPDDPSVAVLQPGARGETFMGLLVGLALAGFGGLRLLALRQES